MVMLIVTANHPEIHEILQVKPGNTKRYYFSGIFETGTRFSNRAFDEPSSDGEQNFIKHNETKTVGYQALELNIVIDFSNFFVLIKIKITLDQWFSNFFKPRPTFQNINFRVPHSSTCTSKYLEKSTVKTKHMIKMVAFI